MTVNLPLERHIKRIFMKKIVKSTLLSLSDERQTKFTNSLKKAQQHNFLSQSGDAPMQVGIPSTTYGKRDYKNVVGI